MRILMTTDAVGGVWQYSLALTRGLVEQQGCRVMLVCLGEPHSEDLAGLLPSDGVELVTLPLKLEWMPDGGKDVERGLEEISRVIARWRPDLIHSNQFCFGLLEARLPKVVVAHSDVLSWRKWHLRERVETRHVASLRHDNADPNLRAYRDLVAAGLSSASAVVCPSYFMARTLSEIYGCPSRVIHNGLWPDLYPSRPKENVALVAGRLWDEAKGAATAVEAVRGLPLELHLLGPAAGPSGETTFLPTAPNVRYLGRQSWQQTREAMAGARFYLATSSYEPFGLAALEAAFCGCTLIAAGTPAYREVWAEVAAYHCPGDPGAVRRQLERLLRSPDDAERLGSAARARAMERYTAGRMAEEYANLYRSLLRGAGAGCSTLL